jgi:hypothetical protein
MGHLRISGAAGPPRSEKRLTAVVVLFWPACICRHGPFSIATETRETIVGTFEFCTVRLSERFPGGRWNAGIDTDPGTLRGARGCFNEGIETGPGPRFRSTTALL